MTKTTEKDSDKIYDEIKFAKAEDLPDSLREKSPVKEGLVALKISISSPPEVEIDEVKGSPTEYIKKLGTAEGIDFKKLSQEEID